MVERPVRFGTAELLPDRSRPGAWSLAVDGVLQSYVDLTDPTYLKLPFTAWIAQAIDHHWPPRSAISAVHIGGGGCTLARYLAATRPGSAQTVFELDAPLVDLLRDHLNLDAIPGLQVHTRDGHSGITNAPTASADLVVIDVFRAGDPVTHLSTVEFLHQVDRVLRPDGLYITNLWGAADLDFVLRAAAAITTVFPHALALAEAAVFMKQRPGNVVIAASTRDLPATLIEWAASPDTRVASLTPNELSDFCGSAPPLTEAYPLADPVPEVHRWQGSRLS